jgi:hypothetical protein
MKKKIISKKLFLTISGIITVVANNYFDLKLDTETVFGVVSMVSAYVIGQGYVDGKKAQKEEIKNGG